MILQKAHPCLWWFAQNKQISLWRFQWHVAKQNQILPSQQQLGLIAAQQLIAWWVEQAEDQFFGSHVPTQFQEGLVEAFGHWVPGHSFFHRCYWCEQKYLHLFQYHASPSVKWAHSLWGNQEVKFVFLQVSLLQFDMNHAADNEAFVHHWKLPASPSQTWSLGWSQLYQWMKRPPAQLKTSLLFASIYSHSWHWL